MSNRKEPFFFIAMGTFDFFFLPSTGNSHVEFRDGRRKRTKLLHPLLGGLEMFV